MLHLNTLRPSNTPQVSAAQHTRISPTRSFVAMHLPDRTAGDAPQLAASCWPSYSKQRGDNLEQITPTMSVLRRG